MATPSNPSGIVPNADEVVKASAVDEPESYKTLYEKVRSGTANLYYGLKTKGSSKDVDKELAKVFDDVEKIKKYSKYKGEDFKKDPVWGLIRKDYQAAKTTSKEAKGSVWNKEKGKFEKGKKAVDIYSTTVDGKYSSVDGVGENAVYPGKESDINKGLLNTKIKGKMLQDFNVNIEDKNLGSGNTSTGRRVEAEASGDRGIDSETFDVDTNSPIDLDDEDGNFDRFQELTERSSNNRSSYLIPDSSRLDIDPDGRLNAKAKKELTTQKKLVDNALETKTWYGMNRDGKLNSAAGRNKRPVKPEEIPMLESFSETLETTLENDGKRVSVPMSSDTEGLIPRGKMINQDSGRGGGSALKDRTNLKNMRNRLALQSGTQPDNRLEALTKRWSDGSKVPNGTYGKAGELGPVIPGAAEAEMENQNKRIAARQYPQAPMGKYGKTRTVNVPQAGGINSQPLSNEVSKVNTGTPGILGDMETRASTNTALGRGWSPDNIERMPPAPIPPKGRGGYQSPIRLNGPESKPFTPQQVNRVNKVVQPAYNPDDVPLAEYTSENNARVNREFTPKGTPPPQPQQPLVRQPVNFPDVNQPMTGKERAGVQERMGYSPKPEVNPNAGVRATGAGPLIPPANVAATASGLGRKFTENAPPPTQFENMKNYRSDPKNQMMEADRVRANNVRSSNLQGPVASGLLEKRFETKLDSASNTEVLSDNDTRTAQAKAQLEDLPEKRKKQINAKVKKIGGWTTGLVGIVATGVASASRYTGTDAGNATADYIEAGMEAYVDNVTMRGYEELGADREKMLGSDLSLAQDIGRGIIPDTIADVAGIAGLISGG